MWWSRIGFVWLHKTFHPFIKCSLDLKSTLFSRQTNNCSAKRDCIELKCSRVVSLILLSLHSNLGIYFILMGGHNFRVQQWVGDYDPKLGESAIDCVCPRRKLVRDVRLVGRTAEDSAAIAPPSWKSPRKTGRTIGRFVWRGMRAAKSW